MEADRNIAAVLRLPHRHHFIGRGRLGVAEEGRPEQLQRAPGERLEQPLRGVELEQGLGAARRREVRVRVGVAADLMAFADHPLEQRALGNRILANDEEGRRTPLAFRMSRIRGVQRGSGPSSKVSATAPRR